MAKRDYYEVLGVSKTATEDEIKKSYRALAKKYHPDTSTEKDAQEKFKEVQEAYEVLKDSQKRANYDRFGFQEQGGFGSGFGSGFDGFGFGGFEDIINAFTGGSSRGSYGPQRGRDLQASVTITFEEAAFGVEKEIRLSKYETCKKCSGLGAESKNDIQTCSKCHGRGKVTVEQNSILGRIRTEAACPSCGGRGKTIKKRCNECNGEGRTKQSTNIKINIPSGIEDGQGVRLNGHGDASPNGGSNGDLIVSVRVTKHELFERDGLDIYLEMPITFSQAALGDTISVPTIHGIESLKIPAGTQSGTKFRMTNKGITLNRGGFNRCGNHYIIVKVVTPTKLSPDQKELFQRLSKTNEKSESFFEKVRKFFKN